MPSYLAKITVELDAEIEFTGESLDQATDWLKDYAKFEQLRKIERGYWPKERVIIHSIEEEVKE